MPCRETGNLIANLFEGFGNIPEHALPFYFRQKDERFRGYHQRRPGILLFQQLESPFETLFQQFRLPWMKYFRLTDVLRKQIPERTGILNQKAIDPDRSFRHLQRYFRPGGNRQERAGSERHPPFRMMYFTSAG